MPGGSDAGRNQKHVLFYDGRTYNNHRLLLTYTDLINRRSLRVRIPCPADDVVSTSNELLPVHIDDPDIKVPHPIGVKGDLFSIRTPGGEDIPGRTAR